MESKMNPYINFKNTCLEAMEFYKSVFGGTLTTTTFKAGGAPCAPEKENNIMHAMLIADNGITLMASDCPSGMEYKYGTNISISLSGENEAELTAYYTKLSSGGTVEQPLTKAPWGDTFGMFMDKFGIRWMVNITAKKA